MTLPVLAIVGRPNVGKSTLFNCLTRSRNALVSDFPGMTRDRQYAEAELAGKRFILIDTGGMTQDENAIAQLTTAQAIQAVNESDNILFLVDARTGITPADQLIAQKLRTFNKSITLVVNKSEDLDDDLIAAEFYRLGIGEPHLIAAAHGRGIDDLILSVLKFEKVSDAPIETEKSIRFAIVGRPNVGKSTLTNRILGEERVIVSDLPGTTRDSISISFERHGEKYTLIDTAGVRRKGKIFESTEKFSVVKTLQAIDSAHIILFLMDAKEGVTEQDLHLLGFILDSGKGLVIAYNKWDGMSEDEKIKARDTLDRRLNFIDFARLHTISALHGTGVGNLFDSIEEASISANKKFPTSRLTKILQEAILQHNPPLVRGRRIKLRYAHAGGHNPPTIVIHGNQVSSLPKAYQLYLAHTYQKRLKLMGTPVRIELKSSDNPFKEKRNKLTPLQQHKQKKSKRYSKKDTGKKGSLRKHKIKRRS